MLHLFFLLLGWRKLFPCHRAFTESLLEAVLAAQRHSYIGLKLSCLWKIFVVHFNADQSIGHKESPSCGSFLIRSQIPEQSLHGFLFAGLLIHLIHQAELVITKQKPPFWRSSGYWYINTVLKSLAGWAIHSAMCHSLQRAVAGHVGFSWPPLASRGTGHHPACPPEHKPRPGKPVRRAVSVTKALACQMHPWSSCALLKYSAWGKSASEYMRLLHTWEERFI